MFSKKNLLKISSETSSFLYFHSILLSVYRSKHIKAPMGTTKYNNCTTDNRTIGDFKSQIQYNSTIAVVQLVPFLKCESRFQPEKTPISDRKIRFS